MIVDSKMQAAKFGDVARALKAGIVPKDALMEFVKTIIADFSGIGAQDVAMAEFVLSKRVAFI